MKNFKNNSRTLHVKQNKIRWRKEDQRFFAATFLKSWRLVRKLFDLVIVLIIVMPAGAQSLKTVLGLDKWDSVPRIDSFAFPPLIKPSHPVPGSMYRDSVATYIFSSQKKWIRIKQPAKK